MWTVIYMAKVEEEVKLLAQKLKDETLFVQGSIDLLLTMPDGRLILVDYKTDRLENEDAFREKYSSQVLIYKKALKMATGYDVKETLLYSFHLGKEIKVQS
mgnify:CR=1 FL=1